MSTIRTPYRSTPLPERIVAVVVDTEVYKEDENYYPVKVTVELYLDE